MTIDSDKPLSKDAVDIIKMVLIFSKRKLETDLYLKLKRVLKGQRVQLVYV